MLNPAQQKLAAGSISSQIVGVWTLLMYAEGKEGCEDTHPFGPKPAGFRLAGPTLQQPSQRALDTCH